MSIYYSPSVAGFFCDDIHGARTMLVLDPGWVAPEIADGEDAPEHPLIEALNPDCKVPDDAVEITDAEHAALMRAQADGQQIVAGSDGRPVDQDRPGPTADELAARGRVRRNKLLAESDWTQARDVPQALADKWAPYRQALRDWPQQQGFPGLTSLPQPPA